MIWLSPTNNTPTAASDNGGGDDDEDDRTDSHIAATYGNDIAVQPKPRARAAWPW